MKVRVAIMKEVELEVNSPDLEYLWESYSEEFYNIPGQIIENALKAVEDAVGLPFADKAENIDEAIVGVYSAEDGETLIEW